MSYLAANGRCEDGRWLVSDRQPNDPAPEHDCGPCIHRHECDCPHGEPRWEPEDASGMTLPVIPVRSHP